MALDSFAFYGGTLASINIDTNGALTVGGADFSNDCIGTGSAVIAPFWDDLSLTAGGSIYSQDLGDHQIIQWDGVGFFADAGASMTFQVKLFDGGAIEFHYGTLADSGSGLANGSSATTGIQTATGSVGLQISCNSPSVGSNTAWNIDLSPLPILGVDAQSVAGSPVSISLQATPGSVYEIRSGGPEGVGGFCDLGTGGNLIASGVTPAGGLVSLSFPTPLSAIFNCSTISVQASTDADGCSNVTQTFVVDNVGVENEGSLDAIGDSDNYTFDGDAGTIVTIQLCRTENTGTGEGTLDPFVSLLDSGGNTLISSDDDGRNCDVPGPFGASLIQNFALPATGSYTVNATAFQGLDGEIGTYRLVIKGCVTNVAEMSASVAGAPFGLVKQTYKAKKQLVRK